VRGQGHAAKGRIVVPRCDKISSPACALSLLLRLALRMCRVRCTSTDQRQNKNARRIYRTVSHIIAILASPFATEDMRQRNNSREITKRQ
jgi:hypothetical protein